MEAKAKKDKVNVWRLFFAVVSVCCIVLSSCTVKSGLKDLLGLRHTTAQHVPAERSGKVLTGSFTANCTYQAATGYSVIQQEQSGLSLYTAALLLSCTLLYFLFAGRVPGSFTAHPGYGGNRIAGATPIFIRHRKLII